MSNNSSKLSKKYNCQYVYDYCTKEPQHYHLGDREIICGEAEYKEPELANDETIKKFQRDIEVYRYIKKFPESVHNCLTLISKYTLNGDLVRWLLDSKLLNPYEENSVYGSDLNFYNYCENLPTNFGGDERIYYLWYHLPIAIKSRYPK